MVTQGGLASVLIKGRVAAFLALCALLIGIHTSWFIFIEFLPSRDLWLALRLPYFNSINTMPGITIATVTVTIVALLFLASAARARQAIQKWAYPQAGRQMMKRVRLSGALMIGLTISGAAFMEVFFCPLGFCLWCTLSLTITQWNSTLQIDSFEPVAGSSIGPLRAISEALYRVVTARVRDKNKKKQHRNDTSIRNMLVAFKPNDDDGPISNLNTQDCLDPWDRLGVSFAALEAFWGAYEIGEDMTTEAVCETIIKPRTRQRQCCFIDLLAGDGGCPDCWLGSPTVFLSHWWGTKFIDLVRIHVTNCSMVARKLHLILFLFRRSAAARNDPQARITPESSRRKPSILLF